MNDELLIQQIKSGDQKALGVLYEDFRSEFVRWIMRDYKCPEDDSKDLYQMSVLIVYENILKGKLEHMTSSLKTYLFSVGKNLVRERNRKAQRYTAFEVDNFVQSLVVEEAEAVIEQKIDLVYACLRKIGPPCKELLEHFYFNRHSMDEITAALGYKNADTAKTQKYKCMGRLRKYFEEEFAKQLT